MQRGYRPEPWNAPRAARKPEASLRAVQARAGYAGGRPRAAPRCCSLATLESVCLPPRTSAFSKPCEAWLREPHGVGDCCQSPTPCRMPRIRLGRQACDLDDVPACGGEAVEPNCIRPSATAKNKTSVRTPSSNCLVHYEGFASSSYHQHPRLSQVIAHDRIVGGAPSCHGQHPKGEAHGHTDSHSRVRVVVSGHRNRQPGEEG